jgi:hypothetical protein
LEGRHDDIPAKAFYFAGGIEEIGNRATAGSIESMRRDGRG